MPVRIVRQPLCLLPYEGSTFDGAITGGDKEAVSKTGQISCSEPERACSDARENVNRKDAKSAKYLV